MVEAVEILSRKTSPLTRGRDLVSAAAAAVADLRALLPRLVAGSVAAEALREAVERAAIDGDNLLQATHEDGPPRLLASLERVGDGNRLHAAVLALDPAALALSLIGGNGPLERLLAARDGDIAVEAALFQDRLVVADSALSVAASRLALQASFVEAILEEDCDHGFATTAAPARDAASAREAALAAGAMLARGPLPIGGGNRRTLEALFAAMDSGGPAA